MKSIKRGVFEKRQLDEQDWKDVVELISAILEQDVDELDIVFCASKPDDCHFRVRSIFREQFRQIYEQNNSSKVDFEQHTNSISMLESFFGETIVDEATRNSTHFLKTQMTRLGKYSKDIIFSQDKKYVLKKIPKAQFQALSSTNTQFPQECLTRIFNKPNSATIRMFGAFEFQDTTASEVISTMGFSYYILMENLLSSWNFADHELLAVYDLKGSNVGRENKEDKSSSSDEEDSQRKSNTNTPNSRKIEKKGVFESYEHETTKFGKDNDLKENEGDLLVFSSMKESIKQELISAIEEETLILESGNTMDYSLIVLLGKIKETPLSSTPNPVSSNKEVKRNAFRQIVVSVEENTYVLSFGIIDFLSQYSLGKAFESSFKSFFCSASSLISCVSPAVYRKRFIKYIKEDLLSITPPSINPS